MKHSIDKQEKVVYVLWKFARAAAITPQPQPVITACVDSFQLGDPVIRSAIKEIMEVFGYEVVDVQ